MTTTKPDVRERNARTACAAYAALNGRDLDAAVGTINEKRACAPRSEFKKRLQRLLELVPDLEARDVRAAAMDRMVVVAWTATGTNSEPLGPLPASGKRFSLPVKDTFVFDSDGGIVYAETDLNLREMARQLGVDEVKDLARNAVGGGPSGRGKTSMFTVEPTGTPEDPLEPGTELRFWLQVENKGRRAALAPVVRVSRADGDQPATVHETAAVGVLFPRQSFADQFTLEAPVGRLVRPGVTELRFAATAEARNGGRAASDEVSVYVGQPLITMELRRDDDGPLRAGARIPVTLTVKNRGKAAARNLAGRLSVEGPVRQEEHGFTIAAIDAGDGEERSFTIEATGPGMVTARAVGEASGVPGASEKLELPVGT